MPLQIPSGPEAIDAAWANEALSGSGVLRGARINGVSVEPVGVGVGILCRLYRLKFSFEGERGGAPASVIIKIASADPQTAGMAGAFKFYEREVRFYDELAGRVSLSTPAPYGCSFDPATGGFIVILEDLGDRRIGDQVVGAAIADTERIVDTMARFHAEWWNKPATAALEWIPTADSDLNKGGMMLYPMALPNFMTNYGHLLTPAQATLAERFAGINGAILDRFGSRPITIGHGDLRLDNVFFATSPGHAPMTVVDWQIAMRAVGTYDIGYFMSQSVTLEDRRKHEKDLLKRYHEALRAGGVSGYSYDEMVEDYRWTLLFCVAYPVMGGGLGDVANERGVTLAKEMTLRGFGAVDDWDAAGLL